MTLSTDIESFFSCFMMQLKISISLLKILMLLLHSLRSTSLLVNHIIVSRLAFMVHKFLTEMVPGKYLIMPSCFRIFLAFMIYILFSINNILHLLYAFGRPLQLLL